MKQGSHAAVLVVEDNEDDVLLMQDAFERAGIDCGWEVVSDGQKAIDYLSAKGAYADRERYPMPEVLLIDLKLPRKSGHEVLEWMRGKKALDGVIRIVLTGSNEAEDLAKSYQLGAHGYFSKPLSPEQLTQPGNSLGKILMRDRSVEMVKAEHA